jgi:thiamine transport system substrate-binding protein
MKKLLLLTVLTIILFSCTKKENNTLVIYGYDSFGWITESVTKQFEEENGCVVSFIPFESSSQVITRLILEKNSPKADVAIGFTPAVINRAISEDILQKYKSKNIDKINDSTLIFDNEFYTTPYDYGALAIIYKPDKVEQEPKTFDDLLKYKGSIIIQDPRTSSTGTDFLLWTIAYHGNEWQNYWLKFRESILTATPGWSESFAAFENDDALMMVSYATDSAYSMHAYGSSAYKAFIPEGKGYVQIEGASVVKGSDSQKLAQKFIDFMLTEDFQKELPLNQWMFPVIDVELPQVYSYALIPDEKLTLSADEIDKNLEGWLSSWEETILQ